MLDFAILRSFIYFFFLSLLSARQWSDIVKKTHFVHSCLDVKRSIDKTPFDRLS